ncbi:MAG TPA: Xaa-Pro peptidase family protein [Malonomonas sp.]
MRLTPVSELENRYSKLQTLLRQQGIDGVVLLQNSDLFYFTGSIQQGVMYVPAETEPVYFVRKDFGRARMESGLRQVVPLSSMRDLSAQLQELGVLLPERLGLELDVLPVLNCQRLQKIFPAAEVVDVSVLIRTVRAIKSDYEISIMKDCAMIMDKVFQHAREVIAVGKTDLEVAAELECFARKQGHQGLIRFRGFNSEIFYGHVFSGADGAVPAYLDAPLGGLGLTPAIGQGASYKKIAAGEPIIIDLITAFDGYLVDQTRTLSVGRLPEQLRTAYFDMLRIQEKLFAIACPGIAWGEVYQQCYDLAVQMGYRDNFMGSAGAQVSFIGHGIGIEVDEYPFIARGFNDQLLEENMTFAFEPKAVFPGLGAVGVENTWRVSEAGIKRLTYSDESLQEL